MTAMILPPEFVGSSRIPDSLKIIFIRGQRGEEIDKPPTDHVAFKVFENPADSGGERTPPRSRKILKKPTMRGFSLLFKKRKSLENMDTTEPESKNDELGSSSAHSRPEKPLSERKLRRGNRSDEDELGASSAHSRPEMPSASEKRKQRRGGVRPAKSEELGPASAHASMQRTRKGVRPKSQDFGETQMPAELATYPSQRSPQVFLDVMLRTRGYSQECFNTLETSYYNKPTLLQIASFQTLIQSLVRFQDTAQIREIMSCGISLNPSSFNGDSLLHTACRNGYIEAVRSMIECGASVQVSDEAGRTPLHAAFFGSKPSFDIVDMILRCDRHLLHLRDRHGATPLSYVPRAHWGTWIDFIYSMRDIYWPRRNKRLDGVAPICEKMNEKPNSAPLPDPNNALPRNVAAMVASGKLSAQEALYLADDGDESQDTGSLSMSDTLSFGLGDDDDDDDDDDDEFDDDWEEEGSQSISVSSFSIE